MPSLKNFHFLDFVDFLKKSFDLKIDSYVKSLENIFNSEKGPQKERDKYFLIIIGWQVNFLLRILSGKSGMVGTCCRHSRLSHKTSAKAQRTC